MFALVLQARCAAASRAAEAAAAERDLLERKVARLEKGKESELKGEHACLASGLQNHVPEYPAVYSWWRCCLSVPAAW
jgi:hypothetical protein